MRQSTHLAPELNGKMESANDCSDVFSLGVVMLKVFTNKTSLGRAREQMKELPGDMVSFIRECLEVEQPKTRPSAHEIARLILKECEKL